MYLCSDGHDQIVYEGGSCPACDLLEKIYDLEYENEELHGRCEELEEETK